MDAEASSMRGMTRHRPDGMISPQPTGKAWTCSGSSATDKDAIHDPLFKHLLVASLQ